MRKGISIRHKHYLLSTAVIFFAYFIRMWGLTSTSLWYDEVFVITHAQQGPIAAVVGLLKEDNALPLHGLLTAVWIIFAGSQEFAVRYLSVLLGTVTAPVILRLSEALTQTRYSGYSSTIAFATLPIFVYYTQEVRMYALAVPLAAAFSWFAIRLYKKGKNTTLYPIIGILMLMTHIYTGLLWVVHLVWGLIIYLSKEKGQDHLIAWKRGNIYMALGSIPIAIWAFWRLNIDATATSAIPIAVLKWIPTVFGIGQYISTPWKEIYTAVTLISICWGYILLIRRRRFNAVVWSVLSLVLPVLILIFATLIKAKWNERYLLPSFGLGLVTSVSWGWKSLTDSNNTKLRLSRNIWASNIFSIILITFWLMGSLPALIRQAEGSSALAIQDEWHPRPDFRGVSNYIERNGSAEDVIVVVAGYAAHTLDYYYDGPAKITGIPLNTKVLNTNNIVDLNSLQILENATSRNNSLWLILWQQHLVDPTNLIESILVAECTRLPVNESFTNIGVLHFNLEQCRPLDQAFTPSITQIVKFSAPIQFVGYDLLKQPDIWEVDLWWKSTGTIENNYSVFVHLVDSSGTIVAQHDHIAGADAYPTSQWREGTYLRNRFFLEVPGAGCESCEIHIGLYTNEYRLDLENEQDTIVIQTDQ